MVGLTFGGGRMGRERAVRKNDFQAQRRSAFLCVSLSRCGLQVLVQRGKSEREGDREGEKSWRRISMASPSPEFQLWNPISVTRSQTRSRRCASAVQRVGEREKKGEKSNWRPLQQAPACFYKSTHSCNPPCTIFFFLHMRLNSNSHVAQRKERMQRNAGSWGKNPLISRFG